MPVHEGLLSAGIAIVEDEPDLLSVYQAFFKKRGIKVCFVASDGIEAVRSFNAARIKPGIILMDQRLPTLQGIDAMKAIKKDSPETRVVFISADPTIKEKALKAGAAAFILKPATLATITRTLDEIY
jgi:two-component system chemotaxis response regulator CheY